MNPPLNLRVHVTRHGTQGIMSVELRDVDGKTLLKYAPGAHIELYLGDGLIHGHSLCGVPEACDRHVVGVLLDCNSHGGLCYMHEQLCVGSTPEIGGLHNHFEVDETASYTVLVTGGIDVAPIICMVCCLAEQGKAFSMLYCARLYADVALADEPTGHGDAVRFHLDAEVGDPSDLKVLLTRHLTDAHFYCCDPGPILRAFEAVCETLSRINVRIEHFAAGPGVESVQDGEYQVKLTHNGARLCVSAGKLLLDALLEIGVEAEHNCKKGVCGLYEIRVLEGEPDYRDNVLSKSERTPNQIMMACMSRCKGKRLVIDL